MDRPLPPGIISARPFVPHTLEHLTEARVFPSPLPEVAYRKMVEEYHALHDVEVWDITYDSGGLTITGLAALPKDREGAQPVMVYNRGGSREYGKLTLLNVLRSMVPFAQSGMLVFASNYRGNAGSEGKEEFGGADVEDVLRLLEIAKAHPAWDGRNAFMLGHSRGGMMAALALKQGAQVNAAISIAGIADARRMVEYPNLVANVLPLVPGWPERGDEVLAKRSAVLWPEKIAAPLLLLHADNDRDVDAADSVALHKAIQAAGGISELVVYEGGGHALLRHWEDVLLRSKAWFGRYMA